MSPSFRAAFTLSVATVAGLLLAALLVFAALDRLRIQAAEANIDFALTQLRQSLESSVSLGLPLADVQIAQDLVERARASNPDILAVEIISATGLSLFNTDRGSLGEAITEQWADAISRARGRRWQVQEVGAIVFGDAIRNDFGERVGGIAITVSGEARVAHANALVDALIPWFVTVAAAAALLVGGATLILLRMTNRDFRQAAQRLTESLPTAPSGHPRESGDPGTSVDSLESRLGGNGEAGSGGGLADTALAMRGHIDRTAARVREAASAVQSLDEDEERDARA